MEISVIVPFRNEERYVAKCIESLLDQDFDPDRYEVIFVDNLSTDNGPSIVKQYPRVKLLTETRGKVYSARNTGVAAARGRILAFTDADCVACRSWLSSIHRTVVDGGATIVLGPVGFPSSRSRILSMLEDYRNQHIDFVVGRRIRSHVYGYTNNMAVRADVFDELGPFLELPVPGDTEIIHRCFRHRPEAKLAYCAEMWIDHLEIETLRILLRKLVLYGELGSYLRLPDYGERALRRTSGAEAHFVRSSGYSLGGRMLFRAVLYTCNLFFVIGRFKGRWQQRLSKQKRAIVCEHT